MCVVLYYKNFKGINYYLWADQKNGKKKLHFSSKIGSVLHRIMGLSLGRLSPSFTFFLVRRFLFGVEASAKREWLVTKRNGPWEGERRAVKRCLARFLLPAFLCAQIFIERKRERDVSVRGRSVAELRAETGPKKNHPGFFAISVKNGEFQANFYIPFERVGMLVKSVRVLRSELLKSCLEHFSKTAPVLHKSRSLSKLINFCLNFRT